MVSEECDRGRELNYVVVYDSSSGPVANATISPANCTNSECRHTLDVSSMRPANYTVSVAAVNVVGEDRSSESETISEYNVEDISQMGQKRDLIVSVLIFFLFLPAFCSRGGKYVSVCKHVANYGGLGACSLRKF